VTHISCRLDNDTYESTVSIADKHGVLLGQIHPLFLPVEDDIELAITSEDAIKIFPNPATDIIHIESVGHEKISEVIIYNTVGQSFGRYHVDDYTAMIELDHIVSGVYIIEVRSKSGATISKFIKSKGI